MDEYEAARQNTKRYLRMKRLLEKIYHYKDFRPKQYEIVNKIVSGKDVCAVLTTGYGKSLCFQLPALYLKKPAIIVSPLISLMDDQQMNLRKLGVRACTYNSTVAKKMNLRHKILENRYRIIYITPESIVNLWNFLAELEKRVGITVVAVDEAHCISCYGYDFRPSYRQLSAIRSHLPDVPILAVTATATERVCQDILDVLKLRTKHVIKLSFNRPNLYLEVARMSTPEVDILPLLKRYKMPSIIYCLTKKDTARIHKLLLQNDYAAGIYHAELEDAQKRRTHRHFLHDKIQIVVATIAFGMGIDKPNIGLIIHYGVPKNLEGYFQEIGRAGRNGDLAYCYIFYHYRDFKIQESFVKRCQNSQYQMLQLELLHKMKEYIFCHGCRRKFILAYFGETLEGSCNFCDNCLGTLVQKDQTDKRIAEPLKVELPGI